MNPGEQWLSARPGECERKCKTESSMKLSLIVTGDNGEKRAFLFGSLIFLFFYRNEKKRANDCRSAFSMFMYEK